MFRLCYGLVLGLSGLLISIGGCGSTSTSSTTPTSPGTPTSSKIQHIVIIMQENRSFDNLFKGFPGADTAATGMSRGQAIPLQAVPLEEQTDLDHTHIGWWTDWDNGLMDGFSHEKKYPIPDMPYAYVPQSETVPIWTLAKTYTLGDRMFQSNTGPSFVAHQYMIAGQSANTDENPTAYPWGCDAPSDNRVALIGPNGTDLPGVYPCLDYPTMADKLDEKGISWRYYAPSAASVSIDPFVDGGFIWSAYQAIHHIRFGPDWTRNVISPNTQVLTDIPAGNLAQVTWIVPAGAYSDHGGPGATAEGPDWVAAIVNAIGQSQFWNSTAIFIAWDDWGGWYDHVNPPQVDAMGLGFRVPLIVVSPYAKRGYISHTTHEFSGFLRYTEEVFNLTSLGTRDATADDFADCFDYTQAPLAYTPVAVTFTADHFLREPPSGPPDND